MSKSSTIIVVLLLIIVGLLVWMFMAKSAEAPSLTNGENGETGVVTPTPTPTPSPAAQPLHEKVTVTFPKANATVSKTFTVTGKAPGNWFFEASAPVMIQTPDGTKIFQGHAQTIGDWMTTNLVDFKADVKITGTYIGPATLVLLKDNPSGIPENDDSLEIPITIQ